MPADTDEKQSNTESRRRRLRLVEELEARRFEPARWPGFLLPFALGWPAVAVAQQLLVAVSAQAIHALAGTDFASAFLTLFLRDHVYAAVALQMFGQMEIAGVSLNGPVGALLHQLWPGMFQPPAEAAGNAWASAIFQPGSSLAGVILVRFLTNALLVSIGFLMA